MNDLLQRQKRLIQWTGILSILTGTLYLPYLPWNVLGGMREAEIILWGVLSLGGGLLAWIGAGLLSVNHQGIRHTIQAVSFMAMILFALGQIPPIYLWMVFERSAFIPLVFHFSIALLAISSGWFLTKGLSLRSFGMILVAFLAVAIGGWGWNEYLNQNWITYSYPEDGAENVPLYDTITVQWEPADFTSMGMELHYEDDPSVPILGATAGSKEGMTFTPEMFLPNKQVIVSVHAGRRSYSFQFTTAEQADNRIDLYRSIAQQLFRAPQEGSLPEVVALDTSVLEKWNENEKRILAKGLMAYHGQVVFGSVREGFTSAEPSFSIPIQEETDALLLTLELKKQEFDDYHFLVKGVRGQGVLNGKPGNQYEWEYIARYREGKWEITIIQEDEPRPWG